MAMLVRNNLLHVARHALNRLLLNVLNVWTQEIWISFVTNKVTGVGTKIVENLPNEF